MTTLIEFLEARLAEDEAAAAKAGGVEWIYNGHHPLIKDAGGKAVVYEHAAPDWFQASHIVRHDPARVLREVAAKRAIMTDIVSAMDGMDQQIHSEWGVGPMDPADYESVELLRILALPYSDHPAYQPDWSVQ